MISSSSGRFRRVIPILLLLFCMFALTACSGQKEHKAEFFVFGTIMEVKTWGATDEQATQAFAGLQQMFQDMHRDWHAWEPGLLMDANQAFAAGEAIELNPQIIEIIGRSQEMETLTGGRFNSAIGKLIGLWGFHTSEYPVIGPPPGEAEINELLAEAPSALDLRVDGMSVRSENPAVQLDLGGIAKGYAVDLAIGYLREAGIDSAIVNAGGDLRAAGRRGERPWRIAVRKPGGGVIGGIEVAGDEAIFTSGNYERFRQDETERYPHILDPRSGWPVADVASATVIAGEGLLADAAATALIVAGLDDWPEVARALGLDQVMMIDEKGNVFLTAAMAQRVRFTEDIEPVVIHQ